MSHEEAGMTLKKLPSTKVFDFLEVGVRASFPCQAWTEAKTFVNCDEGSCCVLFESSRSWFVDVESTSWLASFISLKGGVIAVWFLSAALSLRKLEALAFLMIADRSGC